MLVSFESVWFTTAEIGDKMVDITGPSDQEQVTNVPIDPLSNNPIEVKQTSIIETVPTGDGVDDGGFEASVVKATSAGARPREKLSKVASIPKDSVNVAGMCTFWCASGTSE